MKIAMALAVSLSASAAAISGPPAERFTAFAVNMTNGGTGRSSQFELVIDRWSTAVDRDDLAISLEEQGPDGLLKKLRQLPRVGYVRVAGRLGNDIPFARDVRHSDGSRRIVMVLPRQLSFSEASGATPTAEYPFTVIELQVDAAGRGDGRMSVGAKIKVHKASDQIEHEDFVAGSVLLKDVKVS